MWMMDVPPKIAINTQIAAINIYLTSTKRNCKVTTFLAMTEL